MRKFDGDDGFDRFLAQSLAPPDRVPDKQFMARVSQQILLAKLQRRARAKMFERLGVEVLSIVALGCGLLAVGGGTDIADAAGNIPPMALIGVLILFGLWVGLVSPKERVAVFRLPLR
jgi:hypothetical protein